MASSEGEKVPVSGPMTREEYDQMFSTAMRLKLERNREWRLSQNGEKPAQPGAPSAPSAVTPWARGLDEELQEEGIRLTDEQLRRIEDIA